jgi:hypothetical protein
VALALNQVNFCTADVYDTGLVSTWFDLAHCRLLLCCLQKAEAAIAEMARVVKLGGVVVCLDVDVDVDVAVQGSITETGSYRRGREIFFRRQTLDGLDSRLGPRLPEMMVAAGLSEPEMALIQAIYLRGEEKRLRAYSLAESAGRSLDKGLVRPEEYDGLLTQLATVAGSPCHRPPRRCAGRERSPEVGFLKGRTRGSCRDGPVGLRLAGVIFLNES